MRLSRVPFAAFGIWLDVASCGGSTREPGSAPDAGPSRQMDALAATACLVEATNYDQSCSTDTDCVGTAGPFAVESGNFCQALCMCGGDSINKAAVPRYVRDVSQTPLGSGAIAPLLCSCPQVGSPCCASGRCATYCPSPLPAGVQDAEPAQEVMPPGGIMCSLDIGPFDAGTDASGPWNWCPPPARCVQFNGGWACCMLSPGLALCGAPVANDAGG